MMEHDVVQFQNPKTKLWVKCNKTTGRILDYTDDEEPFANVRKGTKTRMNIKSDTPQR